DDLVRLHRRVPIRVELLDDPRNLAAHRHVRHRLQRPRRSHRLDDIAARDVLRLELRLRITAFPDLPNHGACYTSDDDYHNQPFKHKIKYSKSQTETVTKR